MKRNRNTLLLVAAPNLDACKRSRQQGISLIIVLILTVIIGLTAAAAMRKATSGQQLTNNLKMENMAQQYAEAALRYCEAQVQIPAGSATVRTNNLLAANILLVNMTGTPRPRGNWENTATWMTAAGTTGPSQSRVDLGAVGANLYSSALSSTTPAVPPQCSVEMQVLPGAPTPSFTVTVVTSRGFSSDYAADTNGQTTKGSVVWLQSILNVCAGTTVTCP